MKKIKILFAFAIVLGLTVSSCSGSSSDDDNNNKEASIIGQWELTKVGNILNGTQLLLPFTQEGGCNNNVIELLDNAKYTELEYEYVNSKCKLYSDEGTWSTANKTLTVKDIQDNTTIYEILELSNTTLRLKITQGNDNSSIYALSEYKRK
jgi:hypothetical protein